MSTEQEQDLQEFINQRARINESEFVLQLLKEVYNEQLILKRTIELLVAAGHITEEQAEKARHLATV